MSEQLPNESAFVPIEDVAKHFSVSISTIRGWIRKGHIPPTTYIKIGNTYRFSVPAVVSALTTDRIDIPEVSPQTNFNFDPDEDI